MEEARDARQLPASSGLGLQLLLQHIQDAPTSKGPFLVIATGRVRVDQGLEGMGRRGDNLGLFKQFGGLGLEGRGRGGRGESVWDGKEDDLDEFKSKGLWGGESEGVRCVGRGEV